MRTLRRHALILLVTTACATHVPPSLSGPGLIAWQADQAAVALGTTQHVAIELNKVQICEPMPCHPLLSDANTRIVVVAVTDGLNTLRAAPAGWKATTVEVLARIEARLDAAGKSSLAVYVAAARAVIGGL